MTRNNFLAFLSLIILNSVLASHAKPGDFMRREIRLDKPFNKLIIDGDIDVILTEDTSRIMIIEGESTSVKATRAENKNGVLKVILRKPWYNRKTIVRIPVQNLQSLKIYGEANIISTKLLHSEVRALLNKEDFRVSLNNSVMSLWHSHDYEATCLKTAGVKPLKKILQRSYNYPIKKQHRS